MSVSAVIPVFNKIDLTERCLGSLLENSFNLTEVFVIDNASTDETKNRLPAIEVRFQERGIPFHVIQNEENLGFGRACNQGIRNARGEWIAVLNNDTWLGPEWDKALQREANRRHLDLIGPHFDERPFGGDMKARAHEFLARNRNRFRIHFVPILMFFRKSAIDVISFEHGGIFDERFFVTFEDTDLRYRMEQAGLLYGQTSNAYIWHQSMGTRSTPGLLPSNYEQEGRRIFIEKWGFDPIPLENTWFQRVSRKFRKWNSSRGRF
jgi:GT2 family glycosyltransferase